MQKEGEDRIEYVRSVKGFPRLFVASCYSLLFSLPHKKYSTLLHHAARFGALGALLVITVFFAALVFAQADTGDADQEAIIEQVVSDNAVPTGFVARASEPHESIATGAEAVHTSPVWTASDVVLIVLLVVLVVLFGYFVGAYHRERDAKKGMFGRGPASRTRIIQTSRALTTSARSHVRSMQQFFSRRVKSYGRAKTNIGRELEYYMKHRQEPARPWSAKKPAQSSVSSYEDEYWQRQKEQFWSRVKRAADRIDSAPKTIQQLAVRQVQQYNAVMAQMRQAKEDLYDAGLTKEADATKAQDSDPDRNPALSDGHDLRIPANGTVAQQRFVLNQLKEAHSI